MSSLIFHFFKCSQLFKVETPPDFLPEHQVEQLCVGLGGTMLFRPHPEPLTL